MQSNSNRGRNCCTATQRETRAAWLFLLPSLTGVVLFVLLPFAETVRRSLFDTMGTAWVGLSNYRSVIQNGAFQLAVHNTARFLGICLPILLSGSLVLALVLHSRPLRQTRAARIFKTTFFASFFMNKNAWHPHALRFLLPQNAGGCPWRGRCGRRRRSPARPVPAGLG